MKGRREVLLAGAGAAALGAAAVGYGSWRYLGKHYPPTPYDDLLSELGDREAAKMLGSAFLAINPAFSAPYAAKSLRQRIAQRPLSNVISREIASGHLLEVAHWLIPETLAGLCALAAKV